MIELSPGIKSTMRRFLQEKIKGKLPGINRFEIYNTDDGGERITLDIRRHKIK